jgi:beta-glucosidase
VWFNWDATNFYVTADITEAAFSENYTGANIWEGDGLQVAFTSGVAASATTRT